jgi:hypothetical protein
MASILRASRRSVLGTALAAAGIAGSGLAAKLGGRADDAPVGSDEDVVTAVRASPLPTLYLDRYAVHTSDRVRGAQRKKGDQTLLRGTLTNDVGERVGEVFASALTMPGPLDAGAPHTPRLEIQNFHLADGTILGMGTTFAQADLPNVYTIIGGSGRYAGVRGGYTFDHNPSVASPEQRAAIRFDVVV